MIIRLYFPESGREQCDVIMARYTTDQSCIRPRILIRQRVEDAYQMAIMDGMPNVIDLWRNEEYTKDDGQLIANKMFHRGVDYPIEVPPEGVTESRLTARGCARLYCGLVNYAFAKVEGENQKLELLEPSEYVTVYI